MAPTPLTLESYRDLRKKFSGNPINDHKDLAGSQNLSPTVCNRRKKIHGVGRGPWRGMMATQEFLWTTGSGSHSSIRNPRPSGPGRASAPP